MSFKACLWGSEKNWGGETERKKKAERPEGEVKMIALLLGL